MMQSARHTEQLGEQFETSKAAVEPPEKVGGQPPVIVTGSDTPRHILNQLLRCMRDGRAMVIRLHAITQLQGFVGVLLILLRTADTRVKVRSTGASSDFRVRPKRKPPQLGIVSQALRQA